MLIVRLYQLRQPITTVSDKNSWDTSTQLTVFFFTLAHLLVLPMLFITGNSPNLAHQHWEARRQQSVPTISTETAGGNTAG